MAQYINVKILAVLIHSRSINTITLGFKKLVRLELDLRKPYKEPQKGSSPVWGWGYLSHHTIVGYFLTLSVKRNLRCLLIILSFRLSIALISDGLPICLCGRGKLSYTSVSSSAL